VVADAAYAACRRLARRHYENFPVASRLLPKAMRPHVAAIYAFARTADDFADEGDVPADERLRRLDDWGRRLEAAAEGRAPAPVGDDGDMVFQALAGTIRECRLDPQLLFDLLSAFRQDVLVGRYDDWPDLLDYCRRSANPVGRLVLQIADIRDAAAAESSDALCTALQLTNFWQDLTRDWRKGRVYLPASVLQSCGADEADLAAGALTPAWKSALGYASGYTRRLFDQGRPVADAVPGRLRLELRATWLGGVRILDRLEAVDYDVFARRPTLGWRDAAAIGMKLVVWKDGSMLVR